MLKIKIISGNNIEDDVNKFFMENYITPGRLLDIKYIKQEIHHIVMITYLTKFNLTKELIEDTLIEAEGSTKTTCKLLGVSIQRLYTAIRKFNIKLEE